MSYTCKKNSMGLDLNSKQVHKIEKQYLPTDLNGDSSEERCYTVPAAASYHYVTS